MVICLERGADLHMAQLMPLPLTVSCFSKIQIGSTFLVPAYPGSPGQRAVKRVCVCVCACSVQTAPHITEPDADVARERAYKDGEAITMLCVADPESNAASVLIMPVL